MYLKKAFLIVVFLLTLFVSRPLSAQEPSTSTDTGRTNRFPKQDLRTTIQQQRDELKATVSQKREDFRMILEEKRKEASESFKQKRDLLQQRLQSIKDERKRALVLRINEKMADVNRRRTDQMNDALQKMSSLLDRLNEKADLAKASGKDLTAFERATTEAQTAIEAAQTAIASQAAKVYTLEVTNQETLKTTVGKAASQMQSDLRLVHSLVVEAKQKVAAVIREAARAGVGKIGRRIKVGSPSSTLKPTGP